jgi:hypothetical protein
MLSLAKVLVKMETPAVVTGRIIGCVGATAPGLLWQASPKRKPRQALSTTVVEGARQGGATAGVSADTDLVLGAMRGMSEPSRRSSRIRERDRFRVRGPV